MIRALGKLLMTGAQRDCLVEGGGEGDVVPSREGLRRFSDLLSHKQDFLKNKEKTEDIKVMIYPFESNSKLSLNAIHATFLILIYPMGESLIKIVYDEVEEFLLDKMPSLDQFMEVLGRLYINGFEICDEAMVSYGWGVYLGPR